MRAPIIRDSAKAGRWSYSREAHDKAVELAQAVDTVTVEADRCSRIQDWYHIHPDQWFKLTTLAREFLKLAKEGE